MNKVNQWKKELDRLASLLNTLPLEKTVKWGSDVYTYEGRNVVSYGGFKNFFALWFFNGVFLKDKHKVLISAQEGKTKSLRQWRFTSMEEIDEKKILSYVKEAIEVEKKGLKMAPQKTTAPQLPETLAKALAADKKLKSAFDTLSPSCRKEYILYIAEAKQEATRERRVAKIKEMILEGKGLNDRYKKG
jgi:uncharacterized protein YdeI (YjbR/CyaY-like superfamily)